MNNTKFQYWNICSALRSWGVMHFFHLELLALLWNMHQTSTLIGSVLRILLFGRFTKTCRLSLDCTHCCSLVCQISPQFILVWPSCLTISGGSQLVSNLTGECKSSAVAGQTECINKNQQQQRNWRIQQIRCQWWQKVSRFLLKYRFLYSSYT